jgi:DNA-cytosine methyltransferase
MKSNKIILDACCGGRMFWFNRNHPNVLYVDNRIAEKGHVGHPHAKNHEVKPDKIMDFRNMSFEDNSFKLVVFDPPHLFNAGDKSYMFRKYGRLNKLTWKEDIKKGFDDTRGTLFFDIARILKVKRPKFILLENVKGLLNHEKGKTFSIIIQALEELGYRTQWMVLNSKFFGVPQNRERVFIIGSFSGERKSEILPFQESSTQIDETRRVQEQVASTIFASQHKISRGMTMIQMNNPSHSNDRVYNKEGISPSLNTAQGGNRQPKIITSHSPRCGNPKKGGTGPLESTEHCFTLDRSPHFVNRIRRLTPIECERLQGFPDNWTAGVSDTQDISN